MKKIFFVLCFGVYVISSCNGCFTKPSPDKRTYETSSKSSSVRTSSVEDDPYINNSLSTGATPYPCQSVKSSESTITVRTSSSSKCDLVVMVKSGSTLVSNAYIQAGDSYTFNLPNGDYQVFFYGGRGWKPNKIMPNGRTGGFVANESYSKDNPVSLNYQGLEYEFIPQQNGNFSTKQSNANEIF